MKLYLDTEFNEFGGQLISMGISTPTVLHDFYEVLPCPKPGKWVAEHVIPILGQPAISHANFQSRLFTFLKFFPQPITIVADYPDDISYFCKALITGPGTRIAIDDINFEMRCGLAYVSKLPHNAIFDAQALRAADTKEPRNES